MAQAAHGGEVAERLKAAVCQSVELVPANLMPCQQIQDLSQFGQTSS
jgi:hypothetical protein